MLPGESVWGSPLSLAGGAPVALQTWTQRDFSACTFPSQFPLPLSNPARVLGRTMGRMPGSAPACLPMPEPLTRSPLVPRNSLAGSKEQPRRSRNSKGG